MTVVERVRELQHSRGMPEEMKIPTDLYNALLSEIPAGGQFMKNDGTENIIFPLFSAHVIRPEVQ
jgi:hypothetical protein